MHCMDLHNRSGLLLTLQYGYSSSAPVLCINVNVHGLVASPKQGFETLENRDHKPRGYPPGNSGGQLHAPHRAPSWCGDGPGRVVAVHEIRGFEP